MANGSEFIKNYMDAKNQRIQEEEAAQQKAASDKSSIDKFNTAITNYLKGYSSWAKANNGKYAGATPEDMDARVRQLVKTAGMSEGALNDKSTDVDIANYGTAFLNNLSGLKEDGSEYSFQDYLKDYGTDKAKEAALRQAKATAAAKALEEYSKNGYNVNNRWSTNENILSLKRDIDQARWTADDDNKWINTTRNQYNAWKDTYAGDLYDFFENYDVTDTKSSDTKKDEKAAKESSTADSGKKESETTEDTVTFTLPKANDPNYRGFGQKIVDLGLATSKGLWGADGDVQFYTKQLYDQGALDSRGNLKIGVPIKLKRRKVSK